MRWKMAKQKPTTTPIELDDLGTEDDLLNETVATPIEPEGLYALDYSSFAEGIEDITAESEDHIKALFYGPNGTGKTTVAGTFPGPVLVLDCNEKGTKVLVGTGSKKRLVTTFDMFQMAYWYLKDGKHPYKTVVIDTVTNLAEITMRSILGEDVTRMPHKGDYGANSQILKRWLLDFRNLPMNVVFICQEKRDSDDDIESETASVYPQLSPAVRGILGGGVDVIGNTYIKEVDDSENPGKVKVKFCMRIGPNSKYLAKCRTPRGAKCPASIVNPSYAALRKIMRGEL
jgi:phage nucleotide-binding protein